MIWLQEKRGKITLAQTAEINEKSVPKATFSDVIAKQLGKRRTAIDNLNLNLKSIESRKSTGSSDRHIFLFKSYKNLPKMNGNKTNKCLLFIL